MCGLYLYLLFNFLSPTFPSNRTAGTAFGRSMESRPKFSRDNRIPIKTSEHRRGAQSNNVPHTDVIGKRAAGRRLDRRQVDEICSN
jgi:hypothetical protein